MKLGIILGAFLLLGLSACGTKQVLTTTTKPVLVKPSESMYECPTLADLSPEDLNRLLIALDDTRADYDQAEVAELLWRLYAYNKTCKASIEQIRKFLDDAEKALDQN